MVKGYRTLCYHSNGMKTGTRRILFLSFLAAFLIAAPAVVLYTAGYRYSFSAGRIVQTGILSLGSVPKGASIFVDGESIGSVTPSVVKNILPGEHAVRLEKTGYSTWGKTLSVASRETTFADDVVLFLSDAPTRTRETPLTAVRVNPENGSAAYAKGEGQWTEIWIDDPRDGTERLVSRLSLSGSTSLALTWLSGSVLSIESSGKTRVVTLVDAATGAPVDTSWPEGLSLAASGDRVAVSRKNGNASEILAYVPAGAYQFADAPDGILLLTDTVRDRVVLVNARGGDQPILLNASAVSFQWEPGGRRLLYTDGFDLHVYDASTHSDETITRLSTPITGVGWYPDHGYVLYALSDAIEAVELDHRDQRNVTRLVEGANLGSFAVDQSGRALSFFGTVDGASGLFAKRLQR